MPNEKIRLHAVVFKRGEWWIGQCLQYDIGAEAKTSKQIRRELERAIVAHIAVSLENGLEPFKGIPAAPDRYWKMFEEGWSMEAPAPIEFTVQGRSLTAPTPEVRLSDLVAEPA
jgi:hypothetical protein